MACFSSRSSFLQECTFEGGYTWRSRLTFSNAFCLMSYLVWSFPENYSCDTLFSKPWKKKNQANYSGTLKEMEWNVIEHAFGAVHSTLKGPVIRELAVNPHTRVVCKLGWATVSEGGNSARSGVFTLWERVPVHTELPSWSILHIPITGTSLKETS